MVQEVEVKYRVLDLPALQAALAARGAMLSPPVHQDDQAFAPAGWSYGENKVGVVFARLRTQDGVHLWTVKQPVDNEMACVEHESVVADREAMERSLILMGWAPTVRIVKTRRTARLDLPGGRIAVCVDEVEHAGSFVEMERVVSGSESGAAVQHELDRWARSLGAELERTTDTYDSLVRAALSPA
ncbi:class IV adenylate cyclase [Thermomonospora umbrina]|uniref:Adenylate cyclase n=1 Tax=Thermomonospora umbrina TaxID=111806 RepID=A0A3D9SXP9_9ACTN|nr:CYTH domain-containing protein [Thermomonospora umbrina]REF00733.1 adenylate cyclase [Thermomonospora umbrina]